jgi:DNA gyrase subunit A
MICVNKSDENASVLVISEKGFGKRTAVEEYRITNRGGKGVKTINVTDKTGKLVGILDPKEKDDLIITCKSGITLRTPISAIREAGRATQGVKLIRLDDDDEIAAISRIDEQEIEEAIPELAEGSEAVAEATSATPAEDAATTDPTIDLNNNNNSETSENQ